MKQVCWRLDNAIVHSALMRSSIGVTIYITSTSHRHDNTQALANSYFHFTQLKESVPCRSLRDLHLFFAFHLRYRLSKPTCQRFVLRASHSSFTDSLTLRTLFFQHDTILFHSIFQNSFLPNFTISLCSTYHPFSV
jgi:hypothetical protein